MALFTRTGPDRFNILIRFYDLNMAPRGTLYEPPVWSDKVVGATGRRHEGRKWQSFLMYLGLNNSISPAALTSAHTSATSLSTPSNLPSAHNSNDKTWPWRWHHKSNREEIDDTTNSGLELKIDSWAVGLEADESGDRDLNFPISPWLQLYPDSTSCVQDSDY